MKNLFYLLALGFVFTSCSNDEGTIVETEPTSLLKSYTVSRDSNGQYSVDYDVVDNTTAETVKNRVSNFNEIYLYSGKFKDKKNYTDRFSLENNQLKIAFNENNASRKSLIIEDEDIVLARGASESTDFLQSYSLTDLGDNTYELNFKVRNGVDVSFSYNEVSDVYEVNLREDESKKIRKKFSKIYTKDSKILRIDFVNFTLVDNKPASSPLSNTVNGHAYIRDSGKPKMIVQY